MEIISKMQNVAVITFIITLLLCSHFVRQPLRFATAFFHPEYLQSPRSERELYLAFAELEVRVGFTVVTGGFFFF